MARNHRKEQNDKVYRSIVEFKEHFLPNSHKKELDQEKSLDPKSYGTGLVKELLEGIKREFRK